MLSNDFIYILAYYVPIYEEISLVIVIAAVEPKQSKANIILTLKLKNDL